jgi:enamine deaminase RidA (YjgF/YER057c/UK114 family)
MYATLLLLAGFACAWGAAAADYLAPTTERQKARAYSPAVVTEGGRTVWLAGQTALRDDAGRDLAGNFEAQARQVFRALDATLKRAGGSLANMVTMTVFINDVRNGDKLVEIRKEMFAEGMYPASALITVSGFAQPGMLIEIQGVAVIGDRCTKDAPCVPR